jgi:polysaccharide export outer membrane protein
VRTKDLNSPRQRAAALALLLSVGSLLAGPELNLCRLTIPPQPDYLLGPDDVLEVMVHGLTPDAPVQPLRAHVMSSGDVLLPLVGRVPVGGLNLLQAQVAITSAYADGFIQDPRVNVYLLERSSTAVVVLGEVMTPGVYKLPKYENDVAHALASAGGLRPDAGLEVEVHRRLLPGEDPSPVMQEMVPPPGAGPMQEWECIVPEEVEGDPMRVVRIPLRGPTPAPLRPEDVVLHAGDVIVVPSRKDEVFYVVGKLSPTNFVRFSLSERERDIGAGFLLPRDREIDVVMAVAMAGYIDPIDSPTTVTVHRVGPDGRPMLVLVDLIKARYDRRETILVEPGDIIYLNPDMCWWSRRTFDRILPEMFNLSYRRLLGLGSGN